MLRVMQPTRRHIHPDVGTTVTTPGYPMTWSMTTRVSDATLP